jgi:hypothetical protein
LRQTEWVVYAKRPLAGPQPVLHYLARYTHRVAITNRRLLACQEGTVTFRWKEYQRGNRQRVLTLDAVEFLRRFLLHVLPRGFQRIRHYGLLANGVRQVKLLLCRRALEPTAVSVRDGSHGGASTPTAARLPSPSEVCPACRVGRMQRRATWFPQHARPDGTRPLVVFDTS